MANRGKIILDIWGGELSGEFMARKVCDFDEAVAISRRALDMGYLINMRRDLAWGEYKDEDDTPERVTMTS